MVPTEICSSVSEASYKGYKMPIKFSEIVGLHSSLIPLEKCCLQPKTFPDFFFIIIINYSYYKPHVLPIC